MRSEKITSRIVKKLSLPKTSSHKGENGRLLIIAGSKQYHGSLIYALKAASRIVDLIYVLTTRENWGLVRKLKNKTAEFIPVADLYPLSISPNRFYLTSLPRHGEGDEGRRGRTVFPSSDPAWAGSPSPAGGEGKNEESIARGRKRRGRQGREVALDCILIGPGTGVSKSTYNFVKYVLKSKIRAVLDADALNVLDEKLLKLLGPQHILTPHWGEFTRLLAKAATSTPSQSPPYQPRRFRRGQGGEKEGIARRGGMVSALNKFGKKYGCTVVLKGKIDIVASPPPPLHLPLSAEGGQGEKERGLVRIAYNHTGNEGMTKGGTGDVLAGLIAAFFCRNGAYTSAAAGVYLNGKTGDELYHQVGPFYNAEDLVEQIPKTLWRLIRGR